jgi:nitronate monooxygenase
MIDLPRLKIRDIELPIPIIQGGMGVRISTAPLASAVSNYGALGTLASVGLGEFEPDIFSNYKDANGRALAKEIRRTKQMTNNPIAVNIMSVLTDYGQHAKVCSDEGVDIIISGAGLPLFLPEYVDCTKVKLIPKISSGKALELICKKWDKMYRLIPDAVVFEGPESGGHQGFKFDELARIKGNYLSDNLPFILKILNPFEEKYGNKIPVIVAGGIFTGEEIAKYFKLGASGVKLGSRFVCTEECEVADEYKETYLKATEEDIQLIQSPVGLPLRVIRNKFIMRLQTGEIIKFGCTYKCLMTCNPDRVDFCIARSLVEAQRGNMEDGVVMCSLTTPRLKKIVSVRNLLDTIIEETAMHL